MRHLSLAIVLAPVLALSGIDPSQADGDGRPLAVAGAAQESKRMLMSFDGAHPFSVTLEDNPTAAAFAGMLPLTLDMPDLNRNEKHARLPQSLPASPSRPGTIRAGDIMLYGDDTLVVFYETFQSNYRYTRIGRITRAEGLAAALGPASQRIRFALDTP